MVTDFLLRASDSQVSVSPREVGVPKRRQASPPIGMLDLEHLGSELAQQGGAIRGSDNRRHINDPDSG